MSFESISPSELKTRLDAGWAPYVLDVRGPSEAEIVKLDFADRLHPHSDVASIAAELPTTGDIVVHCKLGGRSRAAIATLIDAGIPAERLFNLDGGIVGWAKDVDPSLPTY